MSDLTSLLLATQDPAQNAAAEAQIRQAEQSSVDQYFTALAQELANNEKPVIARQLSGLLLKNGLAAKDPTRHAELRARWEQLPDPCRTIVKQAVTSALVGENKDVGKAAAQVLAKIGAIEVPNGRWPELIPLLLSHVTSTEARVKQVALVTLGYLCEELVVLAENAITIPPEYSNQILTAIVQGMRDPDMQTKLEATRAFYHGAVLAQKNFSDDRERSFIMEVVSDTCKCEGAGAEAVRSTAFECLVQIATEYYEYIVPYMSVLGPLTWDTIRTAPEDVAIPAMEFWSSICDEELYISDMVASGQAGAKTSAGIIKQALPFLVPLLTETLTRRKSEDDDDTWNLSMAAGTCLTLVAQVACDDCVDLVISFVSANFGNPDWRYREAAVIAFGSIMEGPSSDKMRPFVQQIVPPIVNALNDQNVAVRDSIAWTLGRIAQFHPTIVPVQELTPVLGEKLRDVPRVAANICWVLQVLAEHQPGGHQAPDTTVLSQYFPALTRAMLEVTSRPDATEKNLRMAAYNALSSLVSRSGTDCLMHMQQLTQDMLGRLSDSFRQLDNECELQGYICGVLVALVQRLREKIAPAAEKIMEECLKVFAAYQQVKNSKVVLQEEALLTVGALASAVGPAFERFMPHFAPLLTVGLQHYDDVQTCVIATGIIGDVCRALDAKMLPYCDQILQILYINLKNPSVDRKIKAAVMTSFGDIALAITGEFEKYLAPVVQMLVEASSTQLSDGPAGSEEWVDYLNSLREGVLEAYTGIIHGLRDANKLALFKEHVNSVLDFVRKITEDPSVNEAVMKAGVGVIGDLIQAFQQELMMHLQSAPFLMKLFEYSSRCNEPSTRMVAQWLQQLVARYQGAAPGGQ